MMKNQASGKNRTALILTGLMCSLLMAALDTTIVSTAMKRIAEQLHGMELYAWPFTSYLLTSTLAMPVTGALADRMGRRPVYLGGIALFLIGSVLCGISGDMTQLVVFRCLQGVGGGAIVTIVFTLVGDLFEPEKRGKYTGIVVSVFSIASIAGPLLGGVLTDYLSWRWIFYINIPIGALAVAAGIPILPAVKTAGAGKRFDFPGLILMMLAMTPLLLALSWGGGEYAWDSWPILSLLGFSAAMIALFIRAERRSGNPMIPLGLFKNRTMSVSVVTAFLTNTFIFAAAIFIPYFAQGVIGASATVSGAVLMPLNIATFITSNITGNILGRAKKLKLFALPAYAIMAAGSFLLSTMGTGTAYYQTILFMAILGFGIGINMPVANIGIQNTAPRENLGAATSVLTFFRSIGSTVGASVYGTVFLTSLGKGLSAIDMSALPRETAALLASPQTVNDISAMSQIQAGIPAAYAEGLKDVLPKIREALAGSVHNIFVLCTIVAAIGFVTAFFLKDLPDVQHAAGRGSNMAA